MRKILIPLVLIASALLSGCASIGSGSGRSSWWPDLSLPDYFLWAVALAGAVVLVAGLLVSGLKLARRPLDGKPQRPLAKLGLRYAALVGVILAWVAVVVTGADQRLFAWLGAYVPTRLGQIAWIIGSAAVVFFVARAFGKSKREWRNPGRAAMMVALGLAAALVAYPIGWFVFRADPIASAATFALIGGGMGATAWGIRQQFARAKEEQDALDEAEDEADAIREALAAKRRSEAEARARDEERLRMEERAKLQADAQKELSEIEAEINKARRQAGDALSTLSRLELQWVETQKQILARAQAQPQSARPSNASAPSPVQTSAQGTSGKGRSTGPRSAPAQMAETTTSPKTWAQLGRESIEETPPVDTGNVATNDQTSGTTTGSESSETPTTGPETEAGKGPPKTS